MGVASSHPPAVTLSLFDTFRFEVSGREVVLQPSEQRLLALIALYGRASRSRVAAILWPDTVDSQARTNLRHLMWRLKCRLPGLCLLCLNGPDLRFVGEPDCDVTRLRAEARRILEGDGEPYGDNTLRQGVRELLPDWDEEWVRDDRERLRQLQLHALEAWADALLRSGRFGLALEVALEVLNNDVLRESAHRMVIRIHRAEGNLVEVRRSLARCQQVLASELGVRVSAETAALAR